MQLRVLSLLLVVVATIIAETPQEASIARQREAIAKQREALDAQQGAFLSQAQSIEKQKASAAKQPRPEWPSPPPQVSLVPTAYLDCSPLPAAVVDPIVERAARDNSVTPALVRSVIRQESAFKPCAVSRSGAMGMMQLMPSTAAGLGVSDPFDPQENISAGTKFLRMMLDRYAGDVSLALGAYNAGPGRVDASGGVPPIAETQDYVRSILGQLP